MSKEMKPGMYWHVHHDVLVEYCYDYEERAEYIRKNKPANEVETRLRLFQPVKGKLPAGLVKATKAYGKPMEAHNKVREAYDKASEACNKALEAHLPEIEALHATECGCKEWNGKEIVFGDEVER